MEVDPVERTDTKLLVSKEQQQHMDSKNASGLSRELRRNELIDWQHNDQLNAATKLAIQAFEKEFTFEDYLREREEKEGKKNVEGQESGEDNDDVEEEEEIGIKGWDRMWAERIFLETQEELSRSI